MYYIVRTMSAVQFSDMNFEEQVLKSDKVVIVDFWAEWCHPCRIVSPLIDELAKEYGDKIIVGKMNVDENQQVPSNYGVMSIPTIEVFKGGKVLKTLIGVRRKEDYKKAIDEALTS